MKKNSQIYIIAWPNGAGKITFAKKFPPRYVKCNDFLNADLIAAVYHLFPRRPPRKAGKLLLSEIHSLAEKKKDFAFETTLSGKTHLKFLEEQKKRGYSVHIFFLWLPAVNLAVSRVKERVERGGHYVSTVDVKRRFHRSTRNFFNLYNRWKLSQVVCEELGWLRPDGRTKDMSCRVAMLRMHRGGLIVLPPPQRKNGNGKKRISFTSASDAGFPVSMPAGKLGGYAFIR